MHFSITGNDFKQTLSQFSRLVPHKPLIPAMGYIEMNADTKLHLRVMTAQESLSTSLDAEILKPGKALVPVRLLSEYIKQLPISDIVVTQKGDQLQTEAGGHKAMIPTASSEVVFPEMNLTGKVETWELSVSVLEEITSMVGFSAGSDLNRPVLASIVFDASKGGVVVVTTDGYRLSHLTLSQKWLGDRKRLQVPAKTWMEMTRMVTESGVKTLTLQLADTGFSATFGNSTLMGRYVEGEYPSYQKILPKQQTLEVELPVQELKEAIRLALLFSPTESSLVKWKIDEGVLVVKADSPTQGEQLSHIPVRVIEGETGEIAFNGRFVLEYLDTIKQETVMFSMNNSTLPGKFSHSKQQIHLIMPVRL